VSLHFRPFSHFIVIVGRKGQGKTIFTSFIVKHLRKLIAIDPTWQLHFGYIVHFPERIAQAFQNYGIVIYQPKNMDEESYRKAFEECLKFSNYTLIVDEVDEFAPATGIIIQPFKEIVNRGRAQGIGLICNTRRPASMHKNIRSNADYVVCFQMHEENDVKYMSKWMGVSEEQIRDLPPYHSILYIVQGSKTVVQTPCPLV
jgi:hypothetical protein